MDSSYDRLYSYKTKDDDYIPVKDSSLSLRETPRDSLRRFLSANDIYKATECDFQVESHVQDVSSLQQLLARYHVPEIPSDVIQYVFRYYFQLPIFSIAVYI